MRRRHTIAGYHEHYERYELLRDDGAWWLDPSGELLRPVSAHEDVYIGDIINDCEVVTAKRAFEIVGIRKMQPIGARTEDDHDSERS